MIGKKVLFIGYVWPEPKSSAAGSRILQLIRFFKDRNCEVTFASPAKPGKHPYNLGVEGISSAEVQLNNVSFDLFVKELQPELVVFDRYMMEEQFGWRVAENCPDALRVLDTEDLHFLRNARHEAYKQNKQVTNDLLLKNDLAKREIASIYRCDLTLVISEVEMQLLTAVFQVRPELLCYVPFLLPTIATEIKNTWLVWEEKTDFLFIGNFIHAPNWHAVQKLKNNIWPRIKKEIPKARLHIYGAYASQKVLDLHNEKDGFLIHGWAPDAASVFQKAKVCLVPLYFGAGLKGKLIEAMFYGTPNVTTKIGTEGIQGAMEWSGMVAANDESFIEAAIELYTDKNKWEGARSNGYEILKKRFNVADHLEHFEKVLEKTLKNIQQLRTQNFIGGMLMQQTAQASKFMAKWIEEKNKP